MANIATLLARILTTRYGRDMRQDLHDAIEAVNNDTETALGKKLTFTNNTRKLKLLAKDDTVLSEVVISGGSGSGSVDSVNGLFPDENGNVEVNLNDINDVDITSAADGQTLVYDATSGKWVNGSGGGGTSNYSQLTNKPSINGVTLVGNKTSADLSISGGSNENLLDNPWFTVNQKGFTSGTVSQTGETVPFIDRWSGQWFRPGASASTYTYTSNGLQLNTVAHASGYEFARQGLNQIKESIADILEKQVTFSIKLSNGEIKHTTFTISSSDYTDSPRIYLSENNDYSCCIRITPSTNSLLVFFDNYSETNKGVVIRAVKLELGTESTLALDTAPDYASELLKCQRYYVPLKSYFSYVYGHSATTQIIRYPLATPMRTTPTLYGSATIEGGYNGSYQTETVATSDITIYNNDNIISMRISTTKSYDLGSCCTIGWNDDYLSAEL